MREFRTSGSVGGTAGNCCLYPVTRPEKLRSIGVDWANKLTFNSAFRRQPFRAREAEALCGWAYKVVARLLKGGCLMRGK